MNAALIPVRSIGGSKSRLAGILDAERRRGLALAMLEDMTAALMAAQCLTRVAVVSSDADLIEHARRLGVETIDEGDPKGLNAAVAVAARTLEESGVSRLLTIPGDVPLITPFEIDGVFSVDPGRYPVVVVPSLSATGTNGLLTSPPTVIQPVFEGESLAAYRALCGQRRLEMLILGLEGFAIDVDTPADLHLLARAEGSSAELVRSWKLTGVNDRCSE